MSLFLRDDPVKVSGCVVLPASAGLNSASFLFFEGLPVYLSKQLTLTLLRSLTELMIGCIVFVERRSQS